MSKKIIKTEHVVKHEDSKGGLELFSNAEGLVDIERQFKAATMTTEAWKAMGSPQLVTLTMEPGNKLEERVKDYAADDSVPIEVTDTHPDKYIRGIEHIEKGGA